MSPVKRICVFEHSVMTNFNCACSAIQRGQGSGFLSEDSSWFTACMSEQRRFWRACASAQSRCFAARIGDKYQIRLTRSKWWLKNTFQGPSQHSVFYSAWINMALPARVPWYNKSTLLQSGGGVLCSVSCDAYVVCSSLRHRTEMHVC